MSFGLAEGIGAASDAFKGTEGLVDTATDVIDTAQAGVETALADTSAQITGPIASGQSMENS